MEPVANVTTGVFTIINIITLLVVIGGGFYVGRLLIRALKLYIKKNS